VPTESPSADNYFVQGFSTKWEVRGNRFAGSGPISRRFTAPFSGGSAIMHGNARRIKEGLILK
jgi:hypothetical protein